MCFVYFGSSPGWRYPIMGAIGLLPLWGTQLATVITSTQLFLHILLIIVVHLMNVSSQSNDHILQTASLPDSWKLTLTPNPKRLFFPISKGFFQGPNPSKMTCCEFQNLIDYVSRRATRLNDFILIQVSCSTRGCHWGGCSQIQKILAFLDLERNCLFFVHHNNFRIDK